MGTAFSSGPDIKELSLRYLAGGRSECPESWRYIDITPAYNKIWFIIGGECLLDLNGHEFIARPYQLYLLPCGSKQSYYNISENRVVQYWFHFSAPCGPLDLFKQISLPYCIEAKDVEYLTDLFDAVVQLEVKKALVDELTQKKLMLDILSYYIEHSATVGVYKEPDSHIKSLLEYIENNLDKDLSLQELCRFSHFHPRYFSRYFRAKTGLLPLEYIKKARIERAQKLLETENYSIKEIGSMVGISDISYFSKLFKEKTGFSPSFYRFTTRSLVDFDGIDRFTNKK